MRTVTATLVQANVALLLLQKNTKSCKIEDKYGLLIVPSAIAIGRYSIKGTVNEFLHCNLGAYWVHYEKK